MLCKGPPIATNSAVRNWNRVSNASRKSQVDWEYPPSLACSLAVRETNLAVDPTTGNIYAAWSDFHGAGCNEILFSRSTDHGASFSRPLKISSGICSNQGPSIAIGPSGQVYVGWEAIGKGAAFVSSSDFGVTFSKARVVVTYTRFISGQFSGNDARECGDAPFNCPTGFTFPRFDLANPYLAADNVHKTVVMAFQARQSS